MEAISVYTVIKNLRITHSISLANLLEKYNYQKGNNIMTQETQKHEQYKQIAIASYSSKEERMRNKASIPQGYKEILSAPMFDGLYYTILKKDNELILCFRGTELSDKGDISSDLKMGILRRLPAQANYALNIYDSIKEAYPECKITVIGHSLGGSLAQIIGATRDAIAVTFNAFGTGDILRKYKNISINPTNITNYCNPNDPITCDNAHNHIGKCYEVNSVFVEGKWAHHLECMDSLENRIPITGEELDFQYRVNQRIEREFEHYLRTGRRMPITMPSLGMHSDNCAGTYPVQGYTRDDGTKVSSYTRTCGAKHLNS